MKLNRILAVVLLSAGCATGGVYDARTLAKKNIRKAIPIAHEIINLYPPCTEYFANLGGIPQNVKFYVTHYGPVESYVGWVYRSAPGRVFIQINYAAGAPQEKLVAVIIHEMAHLSHYASDNYVRKDSEGISGGAVEACTPPRTE